MSYNLCIGHLSYIQILYNRFNINNEVNLKGMSVSNYLIGQTVCSVSLFYGL